MRARYRSIQAAAHPYLVKVEDFGDAELEGEPVIYLVTEPTQESLAEIVAQRRLSVDETNDVATSLVGAVEALHGHGLYHGQIEPGNVLAADQVIKLRTDCVRAMPEGAEGDRVRQQDVFGVADTLHRALTQQPLLDASDALALPEPYASIVRNVVRRSWGLEQVASELRRYVRPAAPVQPVVAETVVSRSAVAPRVAETVGSAAPQIAPQRAGEPAARKGMGAASESQLPLLYAAEPASEETYGGTLSPRALLEDDPPPPGRRSFILVALGVLVLVLLLLVWHVSGKSAAKVTAPAQPASQAVVPGEMTSPSSPAAAGPTPARVAAAPVPLPAPTVAAAPAGGKVWRVVAYTYNREDQAQAKVRFLEQKHANLHPQVFSRTGHAPFLVTLGGGLSRDQAAAVRQHARSEGLARDVYMQNYSR